MYEDQILLSKILKNKRKTNISNELIENAKEIMKKEIKYLESINPIGEFNKNWFMGALTAYNRCLEILESLEDKNYETINQN